AAPAATSSSRLSAAPRVVVIIATSCSPPYTPPDAPTPVLPPPRVRAVDAARGRRSDAGGRRAVAASARGGDWRRCARWGRVRPLRRRVDGERGGGERPGGRGGV